VTALLNRFKTDGVLYQRLLGYLKPYRVRFFAAIVASIPASSLNGAIAWMVGPFLDSMIQKQDGIYLALLPMAVLVIAGLQGVFEYLSDYYTNYIGLAVSRDIRMDLYAKLIQKDLGYFKQNSSGDLTTRYYTDPTTLQQAIVTNLQGWIIQVFSAVFLAVVLFYRDWFLAIVAIAVISLIAIPLNFISKKTRQQDHFRQVISAKMVTIIYETLFGMKEILTFQRQAFQEKRFRRSLDDFFSNSMRTAKSEIILKPIMQLIAVSGVAIILYIGIHQVQIGDMTRGDLVSFLVALILMYKPVKVIGAIFGKVQRILAPAERVFQKIDLEANLQDPPTPKPLGAFQQLTLDNVTFAYEPGKPVLKEISLTVNKGDIVALVGPSGSGKSTFVDLIPRFLDPQVGAIYYNGVNVKAAALADVRQQVAIVSQDVILFEGSIRDNLRFGKLDATDVDIMEALRQAYLADWVNTLPQGLDTAVGERGLLVSGGQKQRIAIARAFLKDAPILILDEATSALDSESEHYIQSALKHIMAGRTVFIVAHRLSTIQMADTILVLKSGEIVETGTHDDLIQHRGVYHRLFELQLQAAEGEARSLV